MSVRVDENGTNKRLYAFADADGGCCGVKVLECENHKVNVVFERHSCFFQSAPFVELAFSSSATKFRGEKEY